MNWASGILNASQASYLPLQNNAVLTNRRFEIVGATHNGATILHPNAKVLDFGGFSCFYGKKQLFPRP